MSVNRLRIIAGPNGSGKTTLYFFLKENIPTGIWLNADEILEQFKKKGFIEYAVLGFTPSLSLFNSFCKRASSKKFLSEFNLVNDLAKLHFGRFSITYSNKELSNQLAAFLTDFFRFFLMKENVSFITETVMSHPSKLNLVKTAKKNEYKTYLYFISTNSPEIKISRVDARVFKGGHDVPKEKIASRYNKSIELLKRSLKLFDRVYIFDNSSKEIKLVSSFENGNLEKNYLSELPSWLDFLNSKN